MIPLFFLSIPWLVALWGWGTTIYWPPREERGSESVALTILVGHAPALLFAIAAHLVSPLAGWPAFGFLAIGWALAAVRRFPARQAAWILPVLAVVAAFASRATVHGDSGTYHVQAVAWMADEPVVRGLANLFSCFGYNSSWWLLGGMVSWPFGVTISCSLTSIPLLASSGMLIAVVSLRAARGLGTAADWFLVPAVYFWLRQTVGVNTPAPATDVPANLFIILSLWSLVRSPLFQESSKSWNILPLLFAVIASTVKASALILVVALAALLGAQWLIRVAGRMRNGGRAFAAVKEASIGLVSTTTVLAAALLTLWTAHGILLSGYPAWPARIGSLVDFSWKVPERVLDLSYVRARDWAFTYGADAEARATQPAWKLWLDGQSGRTNLVVAATAAVISTVALAFLLVSGRLRFREIRGLLAPGGIAAIGLIWNLLNVPALRFAAGYAFSLLGCAAAAVGPRLPVAWCRVLVPLWVVVSCIALHRLTLSRPMHLLAVPPLPQTQHQTLRTSDGEEIFFPGDDAVSWLGPLPATVEFNPELIIIRDPKSGRIREFRVPR